MEYILLSGLAGVAIYCEKTQNQDCVKGAKKPKDFLKAGHAMIKWRTVYLTSIVASILLFFLAWRGRGFPSRDEVVITILIVYVCFYIGVKHLDNTAKKMLSLCPE